MKEVSCRDGGFISSEILWFCWPELSSNYRYEHRHWRSRIMAIGYHEQRQASLEFELLEYSEPPAKDAVMNSEVWASPEARAETEKELRLSQTN